MQATGYESYTTEAMEACRSRMVSSPARQRSSRKSRSTDSARVTQSDTALQELLCCETATEPAPCTYERVTGVNSTCFFLSTSSRVWTSRPLRAAHVLQPHFSGAPRKRQDSRHAPLEMPFPGACNLACCTTSRTKGDRSKDIHLFGTLAHSTLELALPDKLQMIGKST